MSDQTDVPAAASGTIELGRNTVVNRLGYGAMRLTGRGIWGEPADPDEARRVLRRAVELGVNFIDTAHAYGPEVNERLIGETLSPYPDDLIVATKGGLQRGGPDLWPPDGRPETLRRECELSLTLLRRETIDLYQLHRPDPGVPIEESLGTIVELQREGKVRLIGVSNVNVDELRRAQAVTEIVSVQNRYSFGDRTSDDVLGVCEREGIVFLPWAPLESGNLTHARRLNPIAADHGATTGQVALAWLLARSPAMLPIPGTSSVAHLEENVAAASLQLNPEELALIA
jgi:pyridoxine 4-dehydrogenase